MKLIHLFAYHKSETGTAEHIKISAAYLNPSVASIFTRCRQTSVDHVFEQTVFLCVYIFSPNTANKSESKWYLMFPYESFRDSIHIEHKNV